MFQKKKTNDSVELEGRYWDAVSQKRVPLLTLDPRWHQLFPDHKKTKELIRLENKLNKLVKQQGQTNQNLKDYEKARKVLMENILNNMTDGQEPDSPIRSMKQDQNQKLMEELKDKIQEAERLQDLLPSEIKEANQELLMESMRICYQTLVDNTRKLREEAAWIKQAREELTEHVLAKQDMEIYSTETYKFMYDLLGAQLLELFDKEYDVWKGEEE
ncbi:MAG: hypothetical protein LUH14_06555 [Clostridiaceae bacterium]|nr:hypothetical protein [Clostridiaceae bacterium]